MNPSVKLTLRSEVVHNLRMSTTSVTRLPDSLWATDYCCFNKTCSFVKKLGPGEFADQYIDTCREVILRDPILSRPINYLSDIQYMARHMFVATVCPEGQTPVEHPVLQEYCKLIQAYLSVCTRDRRTW